MSATLTLIHLEVAAILPGLEKMVNGTANEKWIPDWATPNGHHYGIEVYVDRRFDQEMSDHLLTCRSKLVQITDSLNVTMDSFELAAAALALRVVQAEGLASEEILKSDLVVLLGPKLEAARKRAKRSSIHEVGADMYKQEAGRWQQFVAWLRFRVLVFRRRRGTGLMGIRMLKKEQRETMRQLVADVVIESADQKKIHLWADLARFEVWKGRHPFRLGEILSLPNRDKARAFLARFILEREGLAVLRPEFQPQVLRGSMRSNSDVGRQLEPSTDGETPKSQTVSQGPQPAQTQLVLSPTPGGAAEPNSPQLIPDEQGLLNALVSWMINEVHFGHWEGVAQETKRLLSDYSDYYRISVTSHVIADVIEQCKPIFEASDDFGLINFYSEWAAKWCLASNSNALVVWQVMGTVPLAAHNYWDSLNPLTRKRKISEIARRYFA